MNDQVVTNSFDTKIWWLDGQFHREDGPALIRKDGTVAWWLYDVSYTFNDWLKEVTLDEEQKLLLKLQYG